MVDSVYLKSLGRRKTWLVPTQLLIGILLAYMGGQLSSWLGEDGTSNEGGSNIKVCSV